MYPFLKKILFALEPEIAHALVKKASPMLPKGMLTRLAGSRYSLIESTLGETKLSSPIGLAAGFDKNGEVLDLMASLGFGFIELGSVTALPCSGNPRPRLFRLPKDQSLINRLGLPNWGAEKIAEHLKKTKVKIPLGINLAKTPEFAQDKPLNGIEDFLRSFQTMAPYGAYTVFNLSCPNSGDGRTYEDLGVFKDLSTSILQEKKKLKYKQPILLKLSPDLNKKELAKLVEFALKEGFDGFVVSNTTIKRTGLRSSATLIQKSGTGGLSGGALATAANEQIQKVAEISGPQSILIGVGGLMDFKDLIIKMSLGAQFYQVYTGFIYEGPFFVAKLNRQLNTFCKKMGVANYRELVGNKDLAQEIRS